MSSFNVSLLCHFSTKTIFLKLKFHGQFWLNKTYSWIIWLDPQISNFQNYSTRLDSEWLDWLVTWTFLDSTHAYSIVLPYWLYRKSLHKTVKWETENTVLCEIVLFQIENRDIAKNSTMWNFIMYYERNWNISKSVL